MDSHVHSDSGHTAELSRTPADAAFPRRCDPGTGEGGEV